MRAAKRKDSLRASDPGAISDHPSCKPAAPARAIAVSSNAAGLLFGLGSVLFLIFNGLIIGAICGHLTEIGYGQTFWSFVIGHGAFELTAIALAGAAGLLKNNGDQLWERACSRMRCISQLIR